MDNINILRKQIDTMNLQLLELLNQRTSIINEVIKQNYSFGSEYLDSLKEEEILKNILRENHGPLPNELLRDIFCSVFKSTLSYMGLSKQRELLISRTVNNKVRDLSEILNIELDSTLIIAGPCAIENFEYLDLTASVLKSHNVKVIRGGAFKPRTSPYDFQGLKEEGLKILYEVSRKYDLLSVTEVVDTRDVDMVSRYADILQIGARNMQNYELLKEVGRTKHPVILKRGSSASIEEFILAAEYIASQGNNNIILCERGIRTFETKTRNTLDISAIPIIKKETRLPIIVDLSHSLGRKDIVFPMANAVIAAGADGIMVEVHPAPELALSDSKQQLNIDEFIGLIMNIK
jgi:3-deoxy-7-phosphoheptulonate synthase/chorismate mutase